MTSPRIASMLMALALSGCAGAPSASAPSSPSPTPPSAPSAVAAPTGLQPHITAVSPNVVSSDGGAWGTITGTQFQSGAIVTIGGGPAIAAVVHDSMTIMFSSSGAHAPGATDVIVTNPGGLQSTLVQGYHYVAANAFDPNGEWIAHADAHDDYLVDMRFSIRNGVLVTLSCGTPATLPTTVSLGHGSFSFAGPDGLTLSGTLLSATTAHGLVHAPGCGGDGLWWADKAE